MTSDPMALVSAAMADGVRCVFVTMGSRGVVYFASPDFENAASLRIPRPLGTLPGPIRTALVPAAPVRANESGDSTGCGDVWGATYFSRLLAGDSFACAMDAAMRAAARNVEHRGATGLANYLRGGFATK
jgi:sugar/nucleoside kinase (ribokinase family)